MIFDIKLEYDNLYWLLAGSEEELEREENWMKGRPRAREPLFLNDSQRKHLQAYKDKLGDEWFNTAVQLNQNPAFRAMHANPREMHTIIKNVGILWIWNRSATPLEMATSLGS